VDVIGAALSEVPTYLNHESHRIAVTGLQRSGKTVFVTSLTHALLHASDAPKAAFPFFPWRGQVQHVSVEDIPGILRFPYQERLDGLLAEHPKWPERTTGLTGHRIRILHTPIGTLTRRLLSKATLDLDLIDYPGEWLLDLPMLSQSYQEWSAQMEEMARVGSRADISEAWLEQALRLDLDAKEDAAELSRIGALYVGYIRQCQSEKNLYYNQPGRFLVGDAGDPDAGPIFFPLSRAKVAKAGSNAAALVNRYGAYRKLVRKFYGQVFGRLRRQVVLVDLLTALQQGHESFADMALAVRTITEAFEDLKNPLFKMLPFGQVDRLALVATKADHVTADQLNNLVGLLRDMIGEAFVQANARQSGLLAVASVRSTTEAMRKFDGASFPFLTGVQKGDGPDAIEVCPGVIPGQIPGAGNWHDLFEIRAFDPPRLAAAPARPLPHINLDKVLQFLIA